MKTTTDHPLAAIRAAMRPALRVAIRVAKAELTERSRALAAAQRDHLRAIRAETRTRPVFLPTDSDAALDALATAFSEYRLAAARVDHLGAEYRRNI